MTSADTPCGDVSQARPSTPAPEPGTERIDSLDFIRGLAVMGILAANIAAFGQPLMAVYYPGAFLTAHGPVSDWMWVAQFVLIDGKMRGLFTLLFGAGLYLFMEKAWARGHDVGLQARRLAWLGVFGLIHFFLIWRGDILFLYAVAGMVSLAFIRLSAMRQLVLGLTGYLIGGLFYIATTAPLQMAADGKFEAGTAMAEYQASLTTYVDEMLVGNARETALIQTGDYLGWVANNVIVEGPALFGNLAFFGLETLPLMLIGMALYRIGFFEGRLDPARQARMGWIMLIGGGAASLAIALYIKAGGFTFYATLAAFSGYAHFPLLLMTLGLAALLVLASRGATGWLGERVKAAGRAAFTNYLGTSIVMMVVFHGWGLGWFGLWSRGELYLVWVAMAVVMLAWSKPWLDRYRYGPLEWLWRCLTYGQRVALKR